MIKGNRKPRLLVIAGSDSSGGAGIQRDQRVLEMLGCRALYVISGITTQNPQEGVTGIYPCRGRTFGKQLQEAGSQAFQAIKIGALFSKKQIRLVGDFLENQPGVPLVLDPVLSPSRGTPFIPSPWISLYQKELFPHIDLLCPNLPEILAFGSRESQGIAAAKTLAAQWNFHLYLKGGHGDPKGDLLEEQLVYPNGEILKFHKKRLNFRDSHGTGCSFSTAAASKLAQGLPISQSVWEATELVSRIYSS